MGQKLGPSRAAFEGASRAMVYRGGPRPGCRSKAQAMTPKSNRDTANQSQWQQNTAGLKGSRLA